MRPGNYGKFLSASYRSRFVILLLPFYKSLQSVVGAVFSCCRRLLKKGLFESMHCMDLMCTMHCIDALARAWRLKASSCFLCTKNQQRSNCYYSKCFLRRASGNRFALVGPLQFSKNSHLAIGYKLSCLGYTNDYHHPNMHLSLMHTHTHAVKDSPNPGPHVIQRKFKYIPTQKFIIKLLRMSRSPDQDF